MFQYECQKDSGVAGITCPLPGLVNISSFPCLNHLCAERSESSLGYAPLEGKKKWVTQINKTCENSIESRPTERALTKIIIITFSPGPPGQEKINNVNRDLSNPSQLPLSETQSLWLYGWAKGHITNAKKKKKKHSPSLNVIRLLSRRSCAVARLSVEFAK